MNDEILDLMDQRRIHKNKDVTEYHRMNKEIKKMIRDAKSKWMEEQCEEIEVLTEKHDAFHIHKQINAITGIGFRHKSVRLWDSQRVSIIDEKDKEEAWKLHLKKLFSDARPNVLTLDHATKLIENGKATGLDKIPEDVIRLLNEGNVKHLTILFNQI